MLLRKWLLNLLRVVCKRVVALIKRPIVQVIMKMVCVQA